MVEYQQDVVRDQSTILDVFAEHVARNPARVVVHYRGHAMTLADLDRSSDQLAAGIRSLGIGIGDRVVVQLQNVPEFATVVLAVWKAGAVLVPANPMYTGREMAEVVADCDASIIVGHSGSGAAVVSEGRGLPFLAVATPDRECSHDELTVVGLSGRRTSASDAADREMSLDSSPRLRGGDLAMLVYTSGTSGAPKGARVLHRNVVAQSLMFRDWFDFGPADKVLAVAPLSHITGLIAHLGVSLVTPMTCVLDYRFDAVRLADLCREQECTFIVGAITVFNAFLRAPAVTREHFASVRVAISGGAPVPLSVVEEVERELGMRVAPTYGLTESTSSTHLSPPGATVPVDPESGALSVGRPVTGTEARVVDDDRKLVPAGVIGDIEVRGKGLVDGYWRAEAATRETFVDGWMRTGDVGLERDSWLFVVDRKKDVIIASGFKVWPREVEDVLLEHSGVQDCAVVGVPDSYRGQTVAAFVVPSPGWEASADELIDFCRQRLAAFKSPRDVRFVTALPRTTSGKVLRRELRDSSSSVTLVHQGDA